MACILSEYLLDFTAMGTLLPSSSVISTVALMLSLESSDSTDLSAFTVTVTVLLESASSKAFPWASITSAFSTVTGMEVKESVITGFSMLTTKSQRRKANPSETIFNPKFPVSFLMNVRMASIMFITAFSLPEEKSPLFITGLPCLILESYKMGF